MTLQDLLYKISRYAIKEPAVNYAAAGRSLFELNPSTIKDYAVVFASPTGNHTWDGDITTYTITLFYLDRLLADNSNDISIFSAAIEVLKDIVRALRNDSDIVEVGDNINFINFTETERLSDRVCGAYCTVEISVLNATSCTTIEIEDDEE